MNSNETLLHRLRGRAGARRELHTGAGTVQDLERSVLRNVQRILRSRAGTAPACPGYGLPDLDWVSDGYTEQARRFAEGVRVAIETYEPRVSDVRVITPRLEDRLHAEDPLLLRIEIRARLRADGGRHRARFEATLSADGRVDLGSQA